MKKALSVILITVLLVLIVPTEFRVSAAETGHKGDIVCESDSDGRCHSAESGLCDGPFVLLGTSADNPSPRTIANGDNSDMNGYGYFQNEDGSLYYEVMWNYLNLEHYRGELTGRRRILL